MKENQNFTNSLTLPTIYIGASGSTGASVYKSGTTLIISNGLSGIGLSATDGFVTTSYLTIDNGAGRMIPRSLQFANVGSGNNPPLSQYE